MSRDNAARLTPFEARQLAAFVLGITPDAADETALHAFRLAAAAHNPARGGSSLLYGAVTAAWGVWNQTADATAEDVPHAAAPGRRRADVLAGTAVPSRDAAVATHADVLDVEIDLTDEEPVVDAASLPLAHRQYLQHDPGQQLVVPARPARFEQRS